MHSLIAAEDDRFARLLRFEMPFLLITILGEANVELAYEVRCERGDVA